MSGTKDAFFKKAGALCLTFTLAAGGLTGLFAPGEAAAHHHAYRSSSIVMDAESGMVYSETEADARRYPASLTKVMTMIVAFDALRHGDIQLETELRAPRSAARAAPSRLGLKEGQRISVGDAINALVVKSANDAAITLACGVAGSEQEFVDRMNDKAKDIGLENTQFANASGLPDRDQVTTARDMAKLARHLINEYPELYDYFSQREFEFRGKIHDTHNRLMRRYPGMDGIKTGYINASGHNIISSAIYEDRRMIGVVFGGHSAHERDETMAELLDSAFRDATGSAPEYGPAEERGAAWYKHFFPARRHHAPGHKKKPPSFRKERGQHHRKHRPAR